MIPVLILLGHWKIDDPIEFRYSRTNSLEPEPFEELCLRYSFINQVDVTTNISGLANPYSWIHFIFKSLANSYILYEVLEIFIKDKDLDRVYKNLRSSTSVKEKLRIAERYAEETSFSSNLLVFKRIILTLYILAVNFACFITIDFIYGNFLSRGLFLLIRNRDFFYFGDQISIIFPQFVKCVLDDKFSEFQRISVDVKCNLKYNYCIEKFILA